MILSPRARPLGAVLRIDELAAEAFAKLLGVLALGKAEDIHVGAVSIEAMPARAECEALAEEMDGHIVAAGAAVRGERNLMRPVAVDRGFAEFASSVDHAHSPQGSPPALTQTPGEGSRAFAEQTGRVECLAEKISPMRGAAFLRHCDGGGE